MERRRRDGGVADVLSDEEGTDRVEQAALNADVEGGDSSDDEPAADGEVQVGTQVRRTRTRTCIATTTPPYPARSLPS